MFQWLEQPHELQQSKMLQELVLKEKVKLLSMWDPDNLTSSNASVKKQIDVYQAALHEAVSNRVPLEEGAVSEHWTYTQSVFFASTVLTTIGRFHAPPCIIPSSSYSLTLTLIVIGVIMGPCWRRIDVACRLLHR